jgi:PAS domain S-box-containing protein
MSQIGTPLPGSYDYRLVALSVFIAISTSHTALDLGERVNTARGRTRSAWLVAGAATMGIGIWSMHFIGMLAFNLPIPVAYHLPTVLLSLVAAIFGSAVAFWVVSRERMGRVQAVTGGVLMGVAVAGMHYIGMAAMRVPAICYYNPLLVAVSVLIAVIAALAAIVFTFGYRDDFRGTTLARLASAGIMGAAIFMMHYTGMMSANFVSAAALPDVSGVVSISSLGLGGIALGTLVVQGAAILTSSIDRRRAVQARELQTSERFRQIADISRDVLVLSNPDLSEILFVSRAYETIWGRTLESLYADPDSWLDGVHPEDRGRVEEHVRLLIGGKSVENLEYRVIRPDSAMSWVRLRACPILDEQGRCYRVVVIIHEFTMRRLAEDARRETEEQYRTVVDTAIDAVVSIDESSQIIFVNPATTKLFGYESAELVGQPLTLLMPESMRDSHKAGLQNYLTTGERHLNWQGVELTGLRKNGVEFPIEISFAEIARQGRRVFTGFIRDITERKRAEDRLRQVIDTIPALVWSALPDGSRDFLNQPWVEYSGLSREEALGWGWTSVIHPEHRAIFVDEWRKALTAEQPFEKEACFRRADGQYRWFLIRAVPLRNEDGKIVKWYGTTSDIDDRKRAEDRLRLVIDTIPTMAWTVRPDGSVDFLNQRWLDYTGLSLEEGIEDPMRPIHPEDLPGMTERWRANMAAGKPFQDEIRLRRADGEYRWFMIRTAPVRDEQGNIVKWYGTNTDIEDRKRGEDRLRLVLDTTPALIHSARPDGYLDYFNQRWLEYVGLPLDNLVGWGWTTVIHPEDLEGVLEEWRGSLADGKPFVHESRMRRADGEYRWQFLRKVPLRDMHGNIVKWYGSSIDIEDRKRAELEARTLIEAIPQQIWSGLSDGLIDYCNERWRSHAGIGLEELRGEGWQAMLHPDDRERVLKAWRESVANGTPFEQEERNRGADGQYRWFLARAVPLRDGEGRIIRWYGTNTDIEERKRAEETLRSSEQEQRHVAAQLERERARLVEAQTVAKMGSWEVELGSLEVIWSEQTHRIFETDPARFHATRPGFLEFIHPEDRAKVDAALVTSLDRRSPGTVEYRIVMPDGRVKILEERWQVFLDDEGTPVRLAGTCRDITERVQAEEDLQRLSGLLLQSHDEERRRISRELHDSMGQNLVALATDLSQLRTSVPSSARKLRELASRCEELANACVREVRTLSYLMYPPLLDESGLADAIRHFVDGFTARTGIKVELNVDHEFGRMRKDVELALFRVVQESLANIHRHSGSKRAKILLDRRLDDVTVEVTDSGRGASGQKRGTKRGIPFQVGIGISSMIERVKLIGGHLEIISEGSGTTVRVTIPGVAERDEKASRVDA